MKNFLIAFLVFLVWSFFGLWLYSWLDPIKSSTDTSTNVASALTDSDASISNDEPLLIEDTLELTQEVTDTLSLSENIELRDNETVLPMGLKATTMNGDLLFLFDKGITISINTSEIRIPTEILDFKYKLNTYFIEHPNEELHIASLYSPSENIVSPNFGIQRGKQIEELLITTGIPKHKIVIIPVIREVFGENDEFENGISFSTHPL
ncbi:MAG: hypothetical protein K0U54_00295, partial [Bacteroidetes bacterium]|nr:hypothetical protein [Bacteroidota bacterium]